MQKYYLLFEKYFFWVVLALLVFIPLYPKFPLVGVAGTFVAIRLEDFLIALIVLLWLIGELRNSKKYLRSTIIQAFLLFWFIGALSVISGLLITHTLSLSLGFFNWARRIEFMMLFPVAATSIKSLKQTKIMLAVMLFTTLIIVAYGFGQQWLAFPVISTTNKEFSKGLVLYLTGTARPNSTFAGYYDLAIYLSIVLAILGSLLFVYKKLWKRLVLGITGLLSFVLLGMTSARTSLAAVVIALVSVFWLNGKKFFIFVLLFLCVVTIAAIPNLRGRLIDTVTVNLLHHYGQTYSPPPGAINEFTQLNNMPESSRLALEEKIQKEASESATKSATISSKLAVDIAPGEPTNSTALGVERSFGIRVNVEWPRAIRAFEWNPFLGTGYSSITLATDNDYLRSLGETGILGTGTLVLIFYILIKKLLWYRRDSRGFGRYFIVGVFASVVAVLVTGTFIDVLEASKVAEVFWLLLGFAWAVMGDYKNVL